MKNKIRIKKLYKNVRNWIMENAKQDSNPEKPAYIEPDQLEDLYKYLKDNLIDNNKDKYPCLKCDPNTRLACCGCKEYFEFQAKHAKEKKSE